MGSCVRDSEEGKENLFWPWRRGEKACTVNVNIQQGDRGVRKNEAITSCCSDQVTPTYLRNT